MSLLGLLLLCVSSAAAVQGQTSRRETATAAKRGHAGTAAQLAPAEQQTFAAAVSRYEAGDLAAAKGPLLALAKAHPGAGDVQAAAGMVLAEGGDLAGSVPYLERARRLMPGRGDVAANLGIAYLKSGQSAEAAQALRAARRLDPGNVQTAWTLGQALLDSGDAAGARTVFAEVHTMDPGGQQVPASDLGYAEAVAAWRSGDAAGAQATLNKTSGGESSAQAQALLGEMAEAGGQYESALTHLQSAAHLDPSEGNVYALGVELLRHWTFAPAAEMLEYGVEHFPESRRMRLALGVAYYGGSNYGKAIPVFRALLAASPNDALTADLLGRSCNAQGGENPADAGCADLIAFARSHPTNAPAALYAAVAILHRPEGERDTATAEALLRQALAANPKLPEAYYELGALEQGRNDWAASEQALEQAIALRPTYAEAHYRLSRAYAHLGRQAEARQEVALQQQYSQAEKDALNRQLREVMMFLPGGPEKKTP